MGLWLPDRLIASETSRYVIGVELPADFAGELPDGVDQVLLPPTTYIMFHAPPGDAMFVEVKQAVKAFEAEWDTTTAPVFQYAPDDVRGYVEGLPLAQLGAQSA